VCVCVRARACVCVCVRVRTCGSNKGHVQEMKTTLQTALGVLDVLPMQTGLGFWLLYAYLHQPLEPHAPAGVRDGAILP
jgi:hypothetical protein